MKKAKGNYDYNSVFPLRLRQLCEKHGTTQQNIAEICGTQRQTVSGWMNGQNRPDILSLVKIAEHFNVSTDYLLGLTDYKTTDKATVEMCKALGLSEDAIKILSGDVTSTVAIKYAEALQDAPKETVKKDVESLAKKFALVFNRLVEEYINEQKGCFLIHDVDALIVLLFEFYICTNFQFVSVRTSEKHQILAKGDVIFANTIDGSLEDGGRFGYISNGCTVEEVMLTSAINDILARLNKIKTEKKQ